MNRLLLLKPFVFLSPANFVGHPIIGLLRLMLKAIILIAFIEAGVIIVMYYVPLFQVPSLSQVKSSLKEVQDTLAEPHLNKALKDDEVPLEQLKIQACVLKPDITADVTKSDNIKAQCLESNDSKLDAIYRYAVYVECDKCDTPILPILVVQDFGYPGLFHRWLPKELQITQNNWPIRKITFDAGPYVVSGMLIELLLKDKPSLTRRDQDRIRALLDSAFIKLPAANNPHFIWPRRLVGPIQVTCYVIFFMGLFLMLLDYATNILPNKMLSSIKELGEHTGLTRSTNTSYVNNKAKTATKVKNKPDEVVDDKTVLEENNHEQSTTPNSNDKFDFINTSATPWQPGVKGEVDNFISAYNRANVIAKKKAGLLGAEPTFPLIELRRVGYLAMKISETGANVPHFVSVEAEAHDERNQANAKILQYIIWVIPTLGFIGTVLGIGDALLFTAGLQSAIITNQLLSENRVSTGIGVAFDTTLVALVLSVVLVFLHHILMNQEEKMLAKEKINTLRELLQSSNIKAGPSTTTIEGQLLTIERSSKNLTHTIEMLGNIIKTSPSTINITHDTHEEEESQNRGSHLTTYILIFGVIFVIMAILVFLFLQGDLDNLIKFIVSVIPR